MFSIYNFFFFLIERGALCIRYKEPHQSIQGAEMIRGSPIRIYSSFYFVWIMVCETFKMYKLDFVKPWCTEVVSACKALQPAIKVVNCYCSIYVRGEEHAQYFKCYT